jgi:hypothetical protein
MNGHLKALVYGAPVDDEEAPHHRTVGPCQTIRNYPSIFERFRAQVDMDIFLVLVCGTRAQRFSERFSYTLFIDFILIQNYKVFSLNKEESNEMGTPRSYFALDPTLP